MRPRPATFSAHASLVPSSERPIGVDAASANVVTWCVATLAARIERPTRKMISWSLAVSSGLVADGTGTEPLGLPVAASYHVSCIPAFVVSSRASTSGASASASGVPFGTTLAISVPLRASRTSTGTFGEARGCPSLATDAVGMYATDVPETATARAPLVPGTRVGGLRPTIR
jgi:hypothetical protein